MCCHTALSLLTIGDEWQAARALWDELPKDPMDVTEFLPAGLLEGGIRTKYLRLEMDTLGMDPTKGRVVSIDCLRKKLPR